MFKAKRRNYSESAHQRAFFNLLSLKFPWLRPYVWSSANGGKRNPREAKRLVAEGVIKGVPDIQVCYPSGKYHGLFIEMKRENGNLTKEQKEMFYRLSSVGYKCYMCKSYIEAIEMVEEYLLK